MDGLNRFTRTISLLFFLTLLIFSTASVPNGQIASGGIQPSVGLNKFDLFMQYLGRNFGGLTGPAFQKVSRAMAIKAIIDARNIGVTYFRVSATGFAPAEYGEAGDLDLWQTNPQTYWATFDTMMTDLGAAGIRIVPVFVWNVLQFPAMTSDETITDLIADSTSDSYRLLEAYVREFVERYRDHPALYFYELSNELSDHADIDLKELWAGTGPAGNFSTDQLINFTERLAGLIRTLDPNHLISSGFNLPRRSATHLRKQPDWSPGGDWTNDSQKEFKDYLLEINEPVDIVSIHFYNGIEDTLFPDQRSNLRLGLTGALNVDLLDMVKSATDSAGKLLFVGEFGDEDPFISQDQRALFSQNILNKVVELNIPFSAPWIWEFYQFAPYLFTVHNIEPGYTDLFIEKIKEANERLGNPVPVPPFPDTTPPQVVLVWPLSGAVVDSTVLVAAVASDDAGIDRVEFLVDQHLEFTSSAPPYGFLFDPAKLAAGNHLIAAVATDGSGNRTADTSMVLRSVTTLVRDKDNQTQPRSFGLAQNYPNPFNPNTNITFELLDASFVTLAIYNLLGQEVARPVSAPLQAGKHAVRFDATGLPSGVYVYRIMAGKFTQLRKMLLLR